MVQGQNVLPNDPQHWQLKTDEQLEKCQHKLLVMRGETESSSLSHACTHSVNTKKQNSGSQTLHNQPKNSTFKYFLEIWKQQLFSVLAVWDCSYKVKVWVSKCWWENTDICNSSHSFLSVCLPGFVSWGHSLQMSRSSVVKSKNASLTSTKNLKTVCLHLCITTRQGYNTEEHSNDEIMRFYNVRWLTGLTFSFQNEGRGKLREGPAVFTCPTSSLQGGRIMKISILKSFTFCLASHQQTAPHKMNT